MIIFRIDVDYPYPSRIRSFFYTALGFKLGKDYLKNSKTIAKVINETSKQVKAYWFFTVKTIPDKSLLQLLNNRRHEVSLHIVNDPYKELEIMQEATGRKIDYYTVHGTARLLARMMWRREGREAKIPSDFPLRDFTKLPTTSFALDSMCYYKSTDQVVRTITGCGKTDYVLYFHPIWLFQRGKLNRRGPFYEALARILEVDKEVKAFSVFKKGFIRLAKSSNEYEKDVIPTEKTIERLKEARVDLVAFLERRWCCPLPSPSKSWKKTKDNIAILHITNYEEWWRSIGKKTRNMVRKAEKSGIRTEIAKPDEKLAEGMWRVYNETPIRQERAFPHYGVPLETVKKELSSVQNATYIGAYLQDDLVGFIQLVHGDTITIISQILSSKRHWDKAVNNYLVAKTIELCANQHIKWVMYGRMGNHPSLDNFKENNGFNRFPLTRYYIPLTRKGKMALALGLHRELKDVLPQPIKYRLIPIYNWISRTRMRITLLKTRKILS